MTDQPVLVVDATGAVLGRLASFVAKQSLLGKEVAVVNSEKTIVTGRTRMVIEEYKIARQRGGSSLNGPNFPKHADRLLKRTVRGMLHYNHGRGKAAFKRIKCYIGVPKEFESSKKHSMSREIKSQTITLHELGREL